MDNTDRFRLETQPDGIHNCYTCDFAYGCETFMGHSGPCNDYIRNDKYFLEKNIADFELPD
jgi:hypothetical protein